MKASERLSHVDEAHVSPPRWIESVPRELAARKAAAIARDHPGDVVLAEAGTGVGKTLGYIAPAGLWAEKNKGPVWISTFTRHLQRQIDSELERLFPDPTERRQRVVVRKGREN